MQVLAALANPARLRILEILAEEPESIVADLVNRLPLAQATVSQHLRVLQKAGLIHDERAGAGTCCRLDYVALAEYGQLIIGWTMELAAAAATCARKKGSPCTS